MVTSSLANTEHTSENGIFTVIFDECIAGICKSKNSSALVLGEGGLYVNNTAESGNFMFTLFMISGSLGSEYIFRIHPMLHYQMCSLIEYLIILLMILLLNMM